MKTAVSEKLKKLSCLLPELYLVGGSVRNSLLGLENTDIDVAGPYTPDEIISKLNGSDFSAVPVNKRLGTFKLYDRADKSFYVEYTTFRLDSYPAGSGRHSPTAVEFTPSIEQDARRRDFTVNALYQHIATSEIFDFAGGVDDLKHRRLRTCRAPQEVFSEDGLRLLRLVRFAAELNFEIEAETFAVARELSFLIDDISAERIREELIKIISADKRYPALSAPDAHVRGMRLLDELGLLKRILPELAEGKGLLQDARYHIYDVFEHNMHAYAVAPREVRLAALLHDVGKPRSANIYGNMYHHSDLGEEIVEQRLGARGLRFQNAEVKRIKKLIAGHMYDLDGKASEKKLRLFIVENADVIADLILLKQADAEASRGIGTESVSAKRLLTLYGAMIADGTPFSLSELEITGLDLTEMGISGREISRCLKKVFEMAVAYPDYRTRQSQLNYIRGFIKNGRN